MASERRERGSLLGRALRPEEEDAFVAVLLGRTCSLKHNVGYGIINSTPSLDIPPPRPTIIMFTDVTGREVARLLDGAVEAGTHRVRWDASLSPSGVYIYRLDAGTFTKTRRMTLVK
jgi:hypothetical protein